jgi:peptidoglycan/xylan/chitin deacetylase (PgdA/CDA1 family)
VKKKVPVIVIWMSLWLMFVPAIGSAQSRNPNLNVRREVAITFDDLPSAYGNDDLKRMSDVTKHLLQNIKSNNVPAIGFVNESKLHRRGELNARTALLRMWLEAGLELGNHTFSHINIDNVPLDAYEKDVVRGETVIRRLLAEKGMKLRYFRHPQLHTGPTLEYKKGLEQFLAARGYTIAPVTIDNNDFMFGALYGDAKASGDKETMKRVTEAYMAYMERVFDFFEKLSVDSFGYEVKQTLLLHASDLNADHFDDLVLMMRRRGYTFISLEDALKDKAYGLPDAQAMKGLSWIHRWRLAKGLRLEMEPSEPEFITRLFSAR